MTGRRRDYYRGWSTPEANSLVPAGSALVVGEHGRILMQRRADSGNWVCPAGPRRSAMHQSALVIAHADGEVS